MLRSARECTPVSERGLLDLKTRYSQVICNQAPRLVVQGQEPDQEYTGSGDKERGNGKSDTMLISISEVETAYDEDKGDRPAGSVV